MPRPMDAMACPIPFTPATMASDARLAFQHVTEDAGLAPGRIHLVTEIIDCILQSACILRSILGVLTGTVSLVTELGERVVVGFELAFELVQFGPGIVELALPVLRPRIVLTKRRGRFLQGLAEGVDLGFLRLDLLAKHLIPGRQRLSRLVVLIELGGRQLHLRAKHPHLTVDTVIAHLNSRSPSKPILRPNELSAIGVRLPSSRSDGGRDQRRGLPHRGSMC